MSVCLNNPMYDNITDALYHEILSCFEMWFALRLALSMFDFRIVVRSWWNWNPIKSSIRPFVTCFPFLSSTGFPSLSNTGYSNLNTYQSPFISRSRLSFRYVSIAACILCSFFLLFPSITMSSMYRM